jgi:hypothetical protein
MQRQAVHAKRKGQQVQMLVCAPNRVRPPQPERVIEGPVDRLGVVAPFVHPGEVRVSTGIGRMFLGPIEATFLIVSVALEPDTDLATTEAFGEPGLVAPTKLAGLVLTTLRPHPRQLIKALLTRVGQRRNTNRTVASEQIDRGRGAVVEGDGALLNERRLRHATPLPTPRFLRPGLRGGHLVDRKPPVITHQTLMMHTPQRRVVQDALSAGQCGAVREH